MHITTQQSFLDTDTLNSNCQTSKILQQNDGTHCIDTHTGTSIAGCWHSLTLVLLMLQILLGGTSKTNPGLLQSLCLRQPVCQ